MGQSADARTRDRLVLRPWPAEEAAAAVAGERGPHWALGFPGEADRMIAGLLTREPERPHGHYLMIERVTQVVATVDPANVPSVRVLEKAGLRRDGTVTSDEGTLHRYAAG